MVDNIGGTGGLRYIHNPGRRSRAGTYAFSVQAFPAEIFTSPLEPLKGNLVREAHVPPEPETELRGPSSNLAALLTHVATLQDEVARIREEIEPEVAFSDVDESLPEYRTAPSAT